MARTHSERPPLRPGDIDRLALRYVERYATTRARLRAYLQRKIAERGVDGDPPDLIALADRFAELGYIDDRGYGEAKAAAMGRRGLGSRRVVQALHHAGIEAEDREALSPAIDDRASASALAFAKRRRIGPFGEAEPDRDQRQRQIAAMLRAGHGFDIVRRIVNMAPGADVTGFEMTR